MALMKCPECGKEVSTAASSCPHCGYTGRSSQTTGDGGCISFIIAVMFVIGFVWMMHNLLAS